MNAKQLARKLLETPEDASAGEVNRHLGQVIPRITAPYTVRELRALSSDGEDYFSANVGISLWDLIEHDAEWLNDNVSTQITGNTAALEDISFTPVGVQGEEVIIKVTASAVFWLADHTDEV